MIEYQLSPAQQAIWFEDQVDPGVGNTGFFSVTLVGDVGEDMIEAACRAAVSQHSTMRTIVRMRDGQPVLQVLPATAPLRYGTADVPCEPGEETNATRAWRDRHTRHRFDLTAGPPVAFTLLRHGTHRRSLLVVAHHIGYDGRSKFAFARTFCAALTALRAGRVPETAELPWPHWPDATDTAMAGATEYWQRAGVESYPPLHLPRRAADGDHAIGTTGEVFLTSADRTRLVELAEAHGVSLFAVMLAGVALTLYGYGNRRMVLCAPVDVTTPQTRDLIGLGVNIVPFILSVDASDTVGSVLLRAAAVREHLKSYGAVPFQRLSAGTGWSAGSRALFSRIAVSYMRMATDIPAVPGLRTRWDFVAHNTARTFDLMVHMRDAYDRLVIRLDHAGADLDPAAATAIAQHLCGVLTRMPDRPSAALHRRALLPTESAVSAYATEPVGDLTTMLAKNAVAYADRPAAVGPGGRLDYRDLARLCTDASELTARIQALGASGEPAPQAAPLPGGRSADALAWLVRHLRIASPGPRVLQLAAPGSPQFWQECWMAWAGGGTLYLPGSEAPEDMMRRNAITTVVADWRILRRLAAGGTETLRDAITPMAGLRPSTEIVALARAGVRLHALYAAGAVPIAVQTCEVGDLARGYTPVLQNLAPGNHISVCGPDGQILPHGITGHLYIASPSHQDTGDLAEIDSKGAIRLHGASSLTVEWAGQRLEITAVERYLMTHSEVDDAVVVSAHGRSTAYILPRAGSSLDERALRVHLRDRSVPGEPRLSKVHIVAALPRLPSGEIDREAVLAGGIR